MSPSEKPTMGERPLTATPVDRQRVSLPNRHMLTGLFTSSGLVQKETLNL